eukprot:Hpha_TRINITY_DN15552_c1_g1::TRINITY_DN15552_c1_g1_i1::g.106357::m.106357
MTTIQSPTHPLGVQQRHSHFLSESFRRTEIELEESRRFQNLIQGRDAAERTDYLAVCKRLEQANKLLRQIFDQKARMVERGTDVPQCEARVTVPLSDLPNVGPQTVSSLAPRTHLQLPRQKQQQQQPQQQGPPTDLASAKRVLRDCATFAKAWECRNAASPYMPSGWQKHQEDILASTQSVHRGDVLSQPGASRIGRPRFADPEGSVPRSESHRNSPRSPRGDSVRRHRVVLDSDELQSVQPLGSFLAAAAQISDDQGGWVRAQKELHKRLAFLDSQLQEKVRETSELKVALAAADGADRLAPARVRQQLRSLRQTLSDARSTAEEQRGQQE